MPSSGYSVTNIFANQTGPIPLAQLDTDIAQAAAALNNLLTYGNYFVDSSGVPNTITITPPVSLTFSYVAGLPLQVVMANTNTATAVNINVGGLGNKLVLNSDGTAPSIGSLTVGMLVSLQYDGTNFQILSRPPSIVRGTVQTVFKAAQTSRSSTITMVDDPELIFSSVAGGTYAIKGYLQPQCPASTASGFQFGLRIGGGRSGANTINTQGIINNADYPHVFSSTITSIQQYANVSTALSDFINFEGVVTCGTGDIALQWAQRASSANATLLNDRSWMTITRMN